MHIHVAYNKTERKITVTDDYHNWIGNIFLEVDINKARNIVDNDICLNLYPQFNKYLTTELLREICVKLLEVSGIDSDIMEELNAGYPLSMSILNGSWNEILYTGPIETVDDQVFNLWVKK